MSEMIFKIKDDMDTKQNSSTHINVKTKSWTAQTQQNLGMRPGFVINSNIVQ